MILDWYEKNAKENERLWKLLVRLGESDAKEFDLSSIEKANAAFGDGVDEAIRFREQLAPVWQR
ncbi:MAG: hypothetical protein A2W80_12580 [Candidatus Riflebacteria bacterium GWC2_50_8]|nr:MAG: hypothetical protein A2W80_12580 [Candidatus Riflebacteria bacterium GWC2_50_8]